MTSGSHLEALPDDAPWDEKPGESTVDQYDTGRIPEVDVTEADLRASGDDPRNWLVFGNNYEGHRHATADVITPETVDRLEFEYVLELGRPANDFQGSPLVVHGDPPIIYQTIGPDRLYAIDGRTGDVLWRHVYENADGTSAEAPPAERGPAVLGDTVYKSTLDLGVLAIDRYTGEQRWYYNGAAAYRGEVADDVRHEELQWKRARGTSSSFPPMIYDGRLLKGSFGGEFGVSGFFDAIDLDGNPLWRVNMTPEREWVGDSWKHGGGTAWAAASLDPDGGTVVVPAANPGPWYGTVRPGYNPYTSGKVAIDVETGAYEWHYQDSPHDWWDYDSPSPAIVFEAAVDGEARTFAAWPGKTGWVYTVDVETGKLHQRSEEFVQHLNTWSLPPYRDVEEAPWIMPEVRGGTNPQTSAFDPTTRTMIVKGTNHPMKFSWFQVEYEPGELYRGMDTVRKERPSGVEGGGKDGDEDGDDPGPDPDVETPHEGIVEVGDEGDGDGDSEDENRSRNEREPVETTADGGGESADAESEDADESADGAAPPVDEPVPEWNRNRGVIAGIDPLTGDVKWQNWYGWDETPPWGGSMTTATGITFAGDGRDLFVAVETETGAVLAEWDVGYAVSGAPISWYDPGTGKQYVAAPAGGEREDWTEPGNRFAVLSLEE